MNHCLLTNKKLCISLTLLGLTCIYCVLVVLENTEGIHNLTIFSKEKPNSTKVSDEIGLKVGEKTAKPTTAGDTSQYDRAPEKSASTGSHDEVKRKVVEATTGPNLKTTTKSQDNMKTDLSTTIKPTSHTEYRSSSIASTEETHNCDEIHELSCDEPYYSRIIRVREQCKNVTKQEYHKLDLYRIKFTDKFKLIMCETPKAASSTMQDVLLGLDDTYLKKYPIPERSPCRQYGNECFVRLSKEQIRFRVDNYTSFLVARHPLERLVSAYIDKFEKNNPYYPFVVGQPIARRQAHLYLHGVGTYQSLVKMTLDDVKALKTFQNLSPSSQEEVLDYIHVLKTGHIYFPQFVRHVIAVYKSGKAGSLDLHWKPQVMLCHPCTFNYAYIIKFDDFSKEANRMIDYVIEHSKSDVSSTEDIHIKSRKTAVGRNSVAEKYYKQIPETDVQILRELYQKDFLFYNYDPYLYHGY